MSRITSTTLGTNAGIKVYTDNQNVVRITESGSMKQELHSLAIKIFDLCVQNDISLEIEWVPRSKNVVADLYSKLFDFDDWSVQDVYFNYFNKLWGPFTCDIFADENNHKLPIYHIYQRNLKTNQ